MDEKTKFPPVDAAGLRELTAVLERYKSGRRRTEARIISSENWWKLRNDAEEQKLTGTGGDGGFRSVSGWLHNVIVSKHADAMEAYPEPNILPRERSDAQEARLLSAVVPCILEQNGFERTWSDVMWQKLKSGTGVYKVVWDASKLGGLGDISIVRVNLLDLYWEPGVTDIQRSRYIFHVELHDRDLLRAKYPQLEGRLKGSAFTGARFLCDETQDVSGKAPVIEAYYRKNGCLHYVKFVEDTVLASTENEPELYPRGLYDHGQFPFVFDALFPVEGSPCGYGFVDLCRNPQTEIDLLKTSIVKNAMVGAMPRYFSRMDGCVNEKELLDLSSPLVHVNGNLGEDCLRPIGTPPLDPSCVGVLDRTVQELRETSGNTETASGNIASGVTAASAIAALQEASGKGSRDSNQAAYRAYGSVINLCIELIRQFYSLPRQFRIAGESGRESFVSFTNSALVPQPAAPGQGLMRLPVFDIRVSAQRRSVYTKVSQNELALQLFKLGFFNPQLSGQALMCLEMMDFDGRDDVLGRVRAQEGLYKKLVEYMRMTLALSARYAPAMTEGLAADIAATVGEAALEGMRRGGSAPKLSQSDHIAGVKDEPGVVSKAKERSESASQVNAGAVTA